MSDNTALDEHGQQLPLFKINDLRKNSHVESKGRKKHRIFSTREVVELLSLKTPEILYQARRQGVAYCDKRATLKKLG
jgi:hypothetical protein